MKIEELSVNGFRSLYDVVWRPGDLNVVIGPNASGKSNLLRLLTMLSTSAKGELEGYVRDRGGISALVWDGSEDSIELGVSLNDEARWSLHYLLLIAPRQFSTGFTIIQEVVSRWRDDSSDGGAERIVDRHGDRASLWDDGGTERHLGSQHLKQEETLLSSVGGPFSPSVQLEQLKDVFSDFAIHPNFPTGPSARIRQANVAQFDQRLDHDGQNLVPVLHTLYTGDREFKRAINSAIEAAFGPEFEEILFPPAADQRVQMRIRWRSLKRETSAADLSDGTLRFLFLITALANPYPPSLIAIDEPEIGLHPGMLPIIAEYARQAATRTQVIFTTHSPEFLDAFGDEPPTTTVTTLEEGKTHLKVLSDDALRYWLKEYSLGRMFRSGELEDLE